MADKKAFWGILVTFLAFGLVFTGCGMGNEEESDKGPQFTLHLRITEIPGSRNGETFTMSIIDGGKTMVSQNGTVVNSTAEAELEWDVGTIVTFEHDDGYNYYERSYIGLKIGNDTQKVSGGAIDMLVPSDGGAWMSTNKKYSDLFGN